MTRPLAACLMAGLLAGQGGVSAQVPAGATIIVLPFENPTQEPRLTWMREGAAILLGETLAAAGEVVVDREERLQAFDRLQLPASAATLSRASTIRVGQTVGASVVISGTVAMQGDQLVARARIVRLDTGKLLPDIEARGPLTDLFTVFATLAQLIRASSSIGRRPENACRRRRRSSSSTSKASSPKRRRRPWLFSSRPSRRRRNSTARVLPSGICTRRGSDHLRALDVVSAIRPESRYVREGRFRRALSLMHLKRFDDALQVLRAMQTEAPSAIVANAIGVAELRRATVIQPGRATYFFSQASELDPADGDWFFNLGYAYWLDKDPKAAIYWLREAVRRDPGDGDAHFILGVALQQTGATAEATRERELATRLSSKYAAWEKSAAGSDPVPRGLERLHEELTSSRARVDTMISSAGQRDQENLAVFHLDAGRRAFEREADREAIQELRRALYLSPYLAEAHLLLGRLYLRGGRPAEAVEALKIALWSEETVAAHVSLAEALLQIQDQAAARIEVDRALAIDPKSAEALALKARIGG